MSGRKQPAQKPAAEPTGYPLPAEQARAVAHACNALSHPTRAIAALAREARSPVRLARALDESIARACTTPNTFAATPEV
jgi:hypothetical protein